MSEIQFTPEQQRRMEKLAERVDRVTQADRRFFERFPYRQHRVRLSSQAENQQNEIIADGCLMATAGSPSSKTSPLAFASDCSLARRRTLKLIWTRQPRSQFTTPHQLPRAGKS